MRAKAVAWIAPAVLLAAVPAFAVDGVREINQTCAETTGCFGGDTAGFPVTITVPGSYRLTGNLLIASASTDAIAVASARVSIDLNGFSISGVTSCTYPPLACAPLGSGRGIAVTGPGVTGLAVRNGSVSGMGNAGVYVGDGGRVEDVRASSNGGPGIRTESWAHVLRCTAIQNAGTGILTSVYSLVDGNVVRVTGAGMAGIEAGTATLVRGNQVIGTGGDGILVGPSALVAENSIGAAGGDGINVGLWSKVTGNAITSVVDFGVRFGGVSIYTDNIISPAGGAGSISGAGIDMGGNLCDSGSCP